MTAFIREVSLEKSLKEANGGEEEEKASFAGRS